MIAYLKGFVKLFDERSVLLNVGDIGYRVKAPISVLDGLKTGRTIELYCHTKVDMRNETMELYGFLRAEELAFFEQLLTISGVGPRSALGCLSVAKLEDLKRTIAQGDPKLLQKVAGIGKKTAERIVVELREKIGEIGGGERVALTGGDSEVLDALKGLGYREREVFEVLKGLPKEMEGSEARVKEVLKRLGKRR